MTNSNSNNKNDRLDRIEQTLDRVLEIYERIAKRDEINAIRLERLSLQMGELLHEVYNNNREEEESLLIFSFRVLSWLNTQVVEARSEEEAWEKATQISGGEDNIRQWREISHDEAEEIFENWQ